MHLADTQCMAFKQADHASMQHGSKGKQLLQVHTRHCSQSDHITKPLISRKLTQETSPASPRRRACLALASSSAWLYETIE